MKCITCDSTRLRCLDTDLFRCSACGEIFELPDDAVVAPRRQSLKKRNRKERDGTNDDG